eukprot:TRINITY_DN10683_c0_g2_i7.p2 TRINITY_DN10683_c0_g2~~TRINITY_DN10683_c0_g2_i7.p2  ORF type:complete len:123 (-),score=7.14 TRINITY_DN10683_c0_g2_i7:140-508(-)
MCIRDRYNRQVEYVNTLKTSFICQNYFFSLRTSEDDLSYSDTISLLLFPFYSKVSINSIKIRAKFCIKFDIGVTKNEAQNEKSKLMLVFAAITLNDFNGINLNTQLVPLEIVFTFGTVIQAL